MGFRVSVGRLNWHRLSCTDSLYFLLSIPTGRVGGRLNLGFMMKRLLRVLSVAPALIFCISFLSFNSIFAQSVSVATSDNGLKPVIVTATRNPVSANDVLADYDYIGPEEIERAGQTSLPELLQQQRGIQIQTYGGSGGLANVYLRGTANNQALVLIDGVRTQSSTLGGAVWSNIPVSLIDHIEIIFGPQSTFYGADALGGVIQIFTKRGDGPAKVSASTGYGTYGTSINNASISGSTEGVNKTRYSVGLSQENSTGFNTVAPNNPYYKRYPLTSSAYTREGFTSQLSQDWSEGQEFGLKFLATRDTYQYPGYTTSGTSRRPIYTPQMNQQVGDLFVTSLYSKNQITQDWLSLIQVSNSTNNAQSITAVSSDPINTPQNGFSWQNDIRIGEDTLQVVAERRVQYVNASYSTVVTGAPSSNLNTSRTTDSMAASYQLKRGSNLLTAALRNDEISNYGSQTTGSIAYGYFFTKEFRANINYGTGFRAPTFNDLYYPGYGNANLQPETNRNFEAGVHYEGKMYDLHFVGYENQIKNLIVALSCTTQSSGYCPTNFAKTQIGGLSLGGNARLDDLTFRASYDIMNAVNVATGLQLPNKAKNTANIGADYRYIKTDLGANLTLSGLRYGNAGNTQVMGGYALMNLYVSQELTPELSILAKWNNIFNAQYQLTYGYLTPGSNVFVGLRYSGK